MKYKRMILHAALLPLLLLAACTAPTPTIAPTPQAPAGQPPLPPPLTTVTAARLEAAPDPRYPPADFGKAIALGDGVLAVGAPSVTGGPEYSSPGSVYVYRHGAGSWAEEAQLVASDVEDGFQFAQHFGADLALQDEFLFVGAPQADDPQAGDNTGAVYIFQHGPEGWSEIAILASPQPAASANFGSGLAVHGEHLGVMEGNRFQGSRLRLFQGQGGAWRQTALIEVPIPEGARGGIAAFDLYGDTLALGAQSYLGEGAQAQLEGQVLLYTYDGETWIPAGSLPEDVFGAPLALDGVEGQVQRLAVASPQSRLNGFMSGAVYIYTHSDAGWTLEETLGSPDPGSSIGWGSGYGGSIDLQGDLLLVGGPGASEDSFWDGVAYLYQYSQGRWTGQLRLTHTEDGGFGDFFGSAVEVFGDTLLVSAPDEFGNAVYVFEVGQK